MYIILSSIMRIIYLNEESVDEKIRNKFQEESEHNRGTQQRIKEKRKKKRKELSPTKVVTNNIRQSTYSLHLYIGSSWVDDLCARMCLQSEFVCKRTRHTNSRAMYSQTLHPCTVHTYETIDAKITVHRTKV